MNESYPGFTPALRKFMEMASKAVVIRGEFRNSDQYKGRRTLAEKHQGEIHLVTVVSQASSGLGDDYLYHLRYRAEFPFNLPALVEEEYCTPGLISGCLSGGNSIKIEAVPNYLGDPHNGFRAWYWGSLLPSELLLKVKNNEEYSISASNLLVVNHLMVILGALSTNHNLGRDPLKKKIADRLQGLINERVRDFIRVLDLLTKCSSET